MQNPMVPYFQRVDVPGSLVEHSLTDTHTHTHKQTTVITPPVHARRGLIIYVPPVQISLCQES